MEVSHESSDTKKRLLFVVSFGAVFMRRLHEFRTRNL